VQLVGSRRPITGERTTLPVIGAAVDAHGATWLRVRLPGRPNGHTGWIRRASTQTAVTSWRIVVHTVRPRAVVYWNRRPVRTLQAIVGTPSTPTPLGEFFVEEAIALAPVEAGAPYALALSARSDVFQEFAGGPGQVALHGVANLSGALGSQSSHGCVRLSSSSITWLAARIPPGVPVTIRR
jgi:lipoprotein-anchoring transpeptidase ErfK/SrfK